MNLLKSVFISGLVGWLLFFSVYAVTQIVRGVEPSISWFGLALSAAAPFAFFLKAFLFKSPRTPRHPLAISVLSGLGLALTMAMSYRYGQAAGAIHIWAGATFLGWMFYLRWYSVFPGRGSKVLRVGSALPGFNLESLDGQIVDSENFRSSPHLLVFYRGNWCPFCTAQIEELAADYQQLQAAGITVILVSPQSIQKNQALAARFDVPMVFMRDRNNEAAKRLGIDQQWGTPMGLQVLGYDSDTVMPTVILTDSNGLIDFTDQTDNYRVRPWPKEILSHRGENP